MAGFQDSTAGAGEAEQLSLNLAVPSGAGVTGLAGDNPIPTGTMKAGGDRAEDDDLEAVFQEAKKRFAFCNTVEGDAQKHFLEDYKFAEADSDNGYQWPNRLFQQRDIAGKPCLTINETRQHNLQIINDAKQNKPGIKIRPTGGGASAASAKVWQDIVRHIEYISSAQRAYDLATAFQVKGGWGYIRLVTDYAGPDTFDQEIYIIPVKDPTSIFLDPHAQQPDKSDANYGFVFRDLDKDTFDSLYPEYVNEAGQSPLGEDSIFWTSSSHVRVVEYYRRVNEPDTLIAYIDPNDQQRHYARKSIIGEELAAKLLTLPGSQSRETFNTKVYWYLIIGNKVRDMTEWPGKYIPIIMVIGEETVIEGQLDRKGHTRALKDPQRMYNYWTPLSLDTLLPTPSGWTTMGAVNAGDTLFDEKGQPVKVVGVSPVHIGRKCYEIEFDDGSKITADAEHGWTVEERGKRKSATYDWNTKTLTTKELTVGKHFIPVTKPFDLVDVELPIHPYLLGAWLGDGTSAEPQITAHRDDIEEMRNNIASLGYTVGQARFYRDKSAGAFTIHGVRHIFQRLGLIGNKHIPGIYLRGSQQQREMLLRGMMDTDGAVAKNNQCNYTTIDWKIASGFVELARSLGLKVAYCIRHAAKRAFPNGQEYECKEAFQFNFTPSTEDNIFWLNRKVAQQKIGRKQHWRRNKRHGIKAIREVPSVPVKCVTIDNESHLFLAGLGMVPTHNSAATEQVALQGKSPWLAPVENIEELSEYWNTANINNFAVLPYRTLDDNGNPLPGKPERVSGAQMAEAYITGMQVTRQELVMVSGQDTNAMGQQGNERTGAAINARQRQGNNATYHYIDNLAMAITLVGKQILDLVPKVYDTERVLRITADDGEDYDLTVNPNAKQPFAQQQDPKGKAIASIFNPRIGTYEVIADVGPDYATKREEAWNAYSLILTQNPQLVNIIGDLLFRAADFPHAEEAAKRLKNMVPAEATGAGPSAEVQALKQQIQNTQNALAAALNEIAKKQGKLEDKDLVHDIDAYKAETERLKAIGALTTMSPEELGKLARQLAKTMQRTDKDIQEDLSEDGGEVTPSRPMIVAPGAEGAGGPGVHTMGDAPGIPGARMTSDGHWNIGMGNALVGAGRPPVTG